MNNHKKKKKLKKIFRFFSFSFFKRLVVSMTSCIFLKNTIFDYFFFLKKGFLFFVAVFFLFLSDCPL